MDLNVNLKTMTGQGETKSLWKKRVPYKRSEYLSPNKKEFMYYVTRN